MNTFKLNKYARWYFIIVDRRKILKPVGYTENHHIMPTSLGGPNTAENKVLLTAREHIICHMLLVRMTEGANKKRMRHALNMIRRLNGVVSSRTFAILKADAASARIGTKHTDLSKAKISAKHIGKTLSTEHKAKIGVASNERIRANPELARESIAHARKRAYEVLLARGYETSDETRIKLSNATKAMPMLTCPHCKKEGRKPAMVQWHFDKCKLAK